MRAERTMNLELTEMQEKRSVKCITWKRAKNTPHEEQRHGPSCKYVEIEMNQGTKTNRDDHRL